MELIGILIGIFIIGFIGYWTVMIFGVALIFLYLFWPAALGIVGGIAIWMNGADNAGVIFALACFVGQYFWMNYIDGGSSGGGYDPMAGKRKHYDKQGNLRGYSDKD